MSTVYSFDVGDEVILSATFTDDEGGVSDPDTVRLLVLAPDGTTTPYTYPASVLRMSEGVYQRSLVVTIGGTWRFRWESTGMPTTAEESAFYVRARLVPAVEEE